MRRFGTNIRIYYEDTDAGGVVYYANYLRFLERCRSDWLREQGYDVAELERDHGCVFAVRSVQLEYLRAARLSDVVHVDMMVQKLRRAGITIHQTITRDNEPLMTAVIMVVCVNRQSFKPVLIPQPLYKVINQWTQD